MPNESWVAYDNKVRSPKMKEVMSDVNSALSRAGLGPIAGDIYWVDSVNGDDSAQGSFNDPLDTINEAFDRATASVGDAIIAKPGHVEAITADGGCDADKIGVIVVFLGEGANRAQMQFGTAASASMTIDAASITMVNFLGVAAVDALTGPIDVNAADCHFVNAEWRDAASMAAIDVLVADANADRLRIHGWRHIPSSAGTQKQSSIQVAGAEDIELIGIRIHGDFATAPIENGTAWVNALLDDIIIDSENAGPIPGIVLQGGSVGTGRNINIRVDSGTVFVTAATDHQWFDCWGASADAGGCESFGTAPAASVEGLVTTLTNDVTALDTTVSALVVDVSAVATEISSLQGDVTTIGTGVTALDTAVSALTVDVSAVATEVSSLQGDVTTIGTGVTALDTAVSALTVDVSAVATEVSSLQGDVTTIGTGVTALDTAVSALTVDVSAVATEVSSLQGDVTTIATGVTALDTAVSGLAVDVSAAVVDVSALAVEVSAITGSIGGARGIPGYPAAAAAASNVSLAEVVRYLSENQLPRTVTREITAMTTAAGYISGASVSQFAITGDVLVWAVGTITSAVSSVGGSGTISLGTADQTTALIPTVSAASAILAAGDVWFDATSGVNAGALPNDGGVVIAGGANIILTVHRDLAIGHMNLYVRWLPLSANGAVAAV